MQHSIEPRTRKNVKEYGFLLFARNFSNKYRKKIIGYRARCFKNCFQKVVHKAAKATDEFIGNNIAEKIVKQKLVIDEISINVDEIIIPPEKKEEMLNI